MSTHLYMLKISFQMQSNMTEYCDETTDHTRRLSWDSVVTVGLVLCLLHFPT